jgi:pseudaminic acid biosynthesis-associated methylase
VWRHFDINTPEDWARAEAAFTQPEKAPKVPAHGTEDTGTEEGAPAIVAAPRDPGKPTSTLDFWAGAFGDEYTERNGRVPWSDRVPLWRRVLERTGAKSVLDVGCNAGWNLMALRAIDANIAMTGVDINEQALALAQGDGLDAEHCAAWDVTEKYGENACDLVVTSGVLIHVSPADMARTMKAIRNTTNRWVLAIEYDAPQETEVTYRGHAGKLWKRPYGELYKAMGLALVEFGPAEGFDDCTYWLLEKA